jgi:hypothetical protein
MMAIAVKMVKCLRAKIRNAWARQIKIRTYVGR